MKLLQMSSFLEKKNVNSEIYFQLHFVVGPLETPFLDMQTHVWQSSRAGRPPGHPAPGTSCCQVPSNFSALRPWLCTHTTLTNTHDTDVSTEDFPTLQHNLLQLQKTQRVGGTSELF